MGADGGNYDVAQICVNGHVVNDSTNHLPQRSKDYCVDCGARTVTQCSSCEAYILGAYWGEGFFGYRPPDYCHSCGRAYQWTASRIEAAKDLALEAEGLDEDERDLLARSLDDIIKETPRTQLAASRFKRLMAKAGVGSAHALREFVVEIGRKRPRRQSLEGSCTESVVYRSISAAMREGLLPSKAQQLDQPLGRSDQATDRAAVRLPSFQVERGAGP